MSFPPDLDPARSPELLFGDILDYIEQAEKLLAEKHLMPLAGLDSAVDALCARIMKLPHEQATEYAPELEHLHARLDGLQAAMVKAQHELSVTIKSLGSHHKAALAYLNTPEE